MNGYTGRVLAVGAAGKFAGLVVPVLAERGVQVVNFGSGSMFAGTPKQSHYVAAKAGVLGFSRSRAREVGDYGTTVNVITPGVTVTRAAKDSLPEELLAQTQSSRALHLDEVTDDLVGPVLFLASDDAAFITGQTLNVDGGNHML